MKAKRFASKDLPSFTDDIYLGIDPSLTGFAVCLMSPKGDYIIEVWTSEKRGAARLAEIKNHLRDFLQGYTLSDVAMEGTVVHSASASVLGELSGVVKEFLYTERSVEPMLIPPMSLKKYVCGTGKGVTKSHIMMSTLKKWGVELPDDNAADAHGIARICIGLAETGYETEIVLKMQDPKFR